MAIGWTKWGNGVVGLTLVFSAGSAAAATWPVWRGSKERTAVVQGEFAEGPGAISFRMNLGGDTTRTVMFPQATPGKMLTAVGGSVRSIDVMTGAIDWQSPMLQELTLAGSADVDGDGAAEAVAFTRRQTYVFSSEDGRVVWSSVFGEHSTISAVRLADVTGDGLSEVLIDDCATCGVPGPLLTEVVSFAEGQPRTLWTVQATDVPYHYHQGSDAVLLGLGDGRPVLGLTTMEDMRFVDGATGSPLVVIPRGPHWFAQAAAMVAAPNQVLLFRRTGNATGPTPPVVMSLNVAIEEGTGNVAWEYAGDVYATLELSETSVLDLDADGLPEIVLSEFSREGEWAVVVLDAASGYQRGRFPGLRLESLIDQNATGGKPAVIVSGEAGLQAMVFSDGELTAVGLPLTGWKTTSPGALDPLLVSPIRAAVAQRTTLGGVSLLVGQSPEGATQSTGQYVKVAWAELSASGFRIGETFSPEHPITAIYRADGATRPYAQYAVGTADGNVTVLDGRLRPSSGSLYGSQDCWWAPKHPWSKHGRKPQDDEQTYFGTPVGGRQPGRGNLISQTGDTPLLVVPNTSQGTVVVDARAASLLTPPAPLWQAPSLVKPSVFETDSATVVAGVEDDTFVLRDAKTGALTASAPLDESALGPVGSPFSEPLLLTRDGDTPVITLDWLLPAVRMAQRGFAWAEEGLSEVWTSDPLPISGNFFSSAGRYQVDATTPTADVLVFGTNGTTMYRRSDTGQVNTKAVYTGHYTLPIISDLTGDGENEILFQSGFISPYVYGPNWASLWRRSGPPTYGMAGALVPCPQGPRYVTPFLRSPRFVMYDALTGDVVLDAVAASGTLFGSETLAQTAGANFGFLSNMSTLEGAEGSLLLFGSTDGYLYAVDGCSDSGLVWALYAGSPLGEPSIGDWDGDGKEEILVGASSGHVLGIDFGRLAPPVVAVVRTSHERATLRWDDVPDASGYEYALVTPDGSPVWDPPYRRARGNVARVHLEDVLPGRPFRVAVRAVSGDGTPGSDGFSPALTSSDATAPRLHLEWASRGDQLWLAAADNRELDHYLVWLVDEEGQRTLLDDGFLSGRFARRAVNLSALSAPFDSITVSVDDSAGNTSETTVAPPPRRRWRH